MQCESHIPVLLVNVNNNQIWACYEYSLIMTIKMCTHRLTVCNHSGDVLALILHSNLVVYSIDSWMNITAKYYHWCRIDKRLLYCIKWEDILYTVRYCTYCTCKLYHCLNSESISSYSIAWYCSSSWTRSTERNVTRLNDKTDRQHDRQTDWQTVWNTVYIEVNTTV